MQHRGHSAPLGASSAAFPGQCRIRGLGAKLHHKGLMGWKIGVCQMSQEHLITLGPFRLETIQGLLWRGEQAIPLRQKSFATLWVWPLR
jgi:hypothetical protein